MGHKKILSVLAVLALTLLMVPALAEAAEPMPPSASEGTIQGPELWGVGVIDCDAGIATLRVKQVVNCNVQTEAELRGGAVSCVDENGEDLTERTILYQRLPKDSLFEDPRVPVITKVKNFRRETTPNAYSFDVQIKFIEPPPSSTD